MIVYGAPGCMGCRATERELKKLGIAYTKQDGPQHADYLKGLGYSQMPVVVTEDGQHWSGFDQEKIRSYASSLAATD